ncbi:MAG TPA: VTT domain-containing protein [Anaeromyxobacteraceae bacterium]|nr:VTT domain-containing protein [Anaeromyxobacteraceae bacterium]
MERLAALLAHAVDGTGSWAPLVLFGASFVEYVFPPFPGDTIVVLGAFYAVRGAISWPLAFAAVTAGAVAGAWLDWRVGAALGPRLQARAAHRGPLDAARLARFEAAYRRWGGWLLLGNRFLPGIRAFLFVAAGAARLPLPRVLVLGALSAAAWNALLLAAGGLFARNVDELALLADRYSLAVAAALAAVALVVLARLLARRRRGSVA